MIYYDNAATTFPKPPAVPAAVSQCLREYCGNPGRGGHALSLRAAEAVYQVREAVALFFGLAQPENVIFTQNATHALNMALIGVLNQGDHVLYDTFSHNSVVRPIHALAARGVRSDVYSVFQNGKMLTPEALQRQLLSMLRPETRMLAVTHLSNLCCAVSPLPQLSAFCRAHGLLLLVDASQSAGLLPLDMEKDGISYLCCAGHKGLYGPQGSGLLLIGQDAPLPRPLLSGGSGVYSEETEMPSFLPERLEAGTVATPAIVGLGAGLGFVRTRGTEALAAHHASLASRLQQMLGARRDTVFYCDLPPGGTLLFNLRGKSAEETARLLDREGIAVRGGLHCAPLAHRLLGTPPGGAVRISVGAFNTMGECERFARALRHIPRS